MSADVTPGAKLVDGLGRDWIVTKAGKDLVTIARPLIGEARITRNMARAWADRAQQEPGA